MSLSEIFKYAEANKAMTEALQKIAIGRTDNGRALGGPTSMAIARDALSRGGIDWTKRGRQPVCTEDDGSREPVYASQMEENEAMGSAVRSHHQSPPQEN